MNRTEISKIFGITGITILDEDGGNPLRISEGIEFTRACQGLRGRSYCVRAIKTCTKKRLRFTSTCNTLYDLLDMFVSVKCPYCGGKTEVTGGSGSSTQRWCSAVNVNYRCKKCKSIVSLTVPNDGFSTETAERRCQSHIDDYQEAEQLRRQRPKEVPMSAETAAVMRSDFLSWSGGDPPHRKEQIRAYAENADGMYLNRSEVVRVLSEWMAEGAKA